MSDRLLILWNANTQKQKELEALLENPLLKEAFEIVFAKEAPSGISSYRSGKDELIYSAQRLSYLSGLNDFVKKLKSLTRPIPEPEGGIPEMWTDRELLENYANRMGYTMPPNQPEQ